MTKASRMSRHLVLLQLLIGWLPLWALFTALILTNHPDATLPVATLISLRMIVAAAVLGLLVQRIIERFPWKSPVSLAFVGLHLIAAIGYALAWVFLNSVIESVMRGALLVVVGVGLHSFLMVGVWLYVMIAGVSYTIHSTERAARAEATAAHAQLSALRSQLNPHFLFNALHTVVQLIPRQPKQAAAAAEQLADILRTTMEEDRDTVSVSEELSFVRQYLGVERIRFGDRLRIHIEIPDREQSATIPSFAIQTLVENAVRHGAAPRVDSTDITVVGKLETSAFILTVTDNGVGATQEEVRNSKGTGLRRLRERLDALYGNRAKLEIGSSVEGGLRVSMVIPQDATD